MSEKSISSQWRTRRSGSKCQCARASYAAAAASSIDTTSAAETETDGASTAGEAAEGYLPTPTLMHSENADVETDPA